MPVSANLKTTTLGCKVNQYETQFVRDALVGIGYQEDETQPADLCIVNTCTVTNEGDAKSRQIIRRMHRDNPAARIIVMGCYATRRPDDVAQLPGVEEVVTDKRELPDLLGRFGVVDLPRGIQGLSGRSRAYVKIQDGCLLRCSYCIIPQVRPQMYSRPATEVLDEIRGLVENGFREVVLTGIHLGHYGVDFNRGKPKSEWVRLSSLLRQICDIPGEFRVRLSSIEATEVTRELLMVMAQFPEKVCPHFHVCLQSGSDRILTAMKRRWGVRRFVDRCQLIKDSLPYPAFSTDVIVGFPGESEADFESTLQVCRTVGFSKIHMFPFSPRSGTPAADMPEQVAKSVKQQRGARVASLEAELRHEYFGQLLGQPLQLLVESAKAETSESSEPGVEGTATRLRGTSCRFAPVETVLSLPAQSHENLRRPGVGELLNVRPTEIESAGLLAVADPTLN